MRTQKVPSSSISWSSPKKRVRDEDYNQPVAKRRKDSTHETRVGDKAEKECLEINAEQESLEIVRR